MNIEKLDICERLTQSAGITTCFIPRLELTKQELDDAIKAIYEDRNDACIEIESLRKKVRVLRETQEPKSDYDYWSHNHTMTEGDMDD